MSRLVYFDILKFLAIFLVVVGHCIQRSYMAMDMNTELFYNDFVFKFIYACHLPLFMAISGYFFYGTMQKYSYQEILKTRITRLLLPIASWHLVWMLTDGFSNNGGGYTLLTFATDFLTHYWYLWAVFYCSLAVMVIRILFKNNKYIYFFIIPLTLLLPNYINIDRYVYLFPFFIVGYFLNFKSPVLQKRSLIMLLGGVLVCYFILLSYFSYDHYIYTTGTCVIKDWSFSVDQLSIDFFRYLIGFIGVAVFYFLSLFLKDLRLPKVFSDIGSKTLGIYIIHMFFTPFISDYNIGVNYVYVVCEAILLVVSSYYFVKLIEKNSFLSKILLGRERP